MYPKTHLHLNSKQSGQVMIALIGLTLTKHVVDELKAASRIRRSKKAAPKARKFDNVWIKEDPKTGLVTVLTVYKGENTAKQYTWTHSK